jgi:hypothetical protein
MTIPVTGTLAPSAGDNTFPILEDVNFLGGLRAVADHTDRDAISALDRKQGMQVVTNNDGVTWSLGSDLTTWTQVSQLAFTNIAQMVAANATSLADGSVASVGVVNALYRLEKTPPAAVLAGADASNIVTASAPAGAIWARLGGWNQDARYATDWYVDAVSGDDAADGQTALTPLKTIAEVSRRLSGIALQVFTTVHLAAGAYGACRFDIQQGAVDGAGILVVGTVSSSSPVALTGVTATNPNTSTRGRIQAATTFVDATRLRLVSGAGSGAMAEVTRVIGVGDANVTEWSQISSLQFGTLTNQATPSIGDQFVVDTIQSSVTLIDMQCDSSVRGRVIIQNCNIRQTAAGSVPQAHRMRGNSSPSLGIGALIYACNFADAGGSAFQDCYTMFFCCSVDTQAIFSKSFIALAGGSCRGLMTLIQGGFIQTRGPYCFDAGRLVLSAGIWSSNGTNLQFCDSAGGAAVQCSVSGRSYSSGASAPWWSSDCTFATGVAVASGCGVFYTTLPTIVAATQEVLLGGVAHTYAAVNASGGLMNTNNGAVMAVLA